MRKQLKDYAGLLERHPEELFDDPHSARPGYLPQGQALILDQARRLEPVVAKIIQEVSPGLVSPPYRLPRPVSERLELVRQAPYPQLHR